MTPNNPPAFPRLLSHEEGDYGKTHYAAEHGMTLRDWFAGQVVSATLVGSYSGNITTPEIARAVAEEAYLVADAMLVARQEQGK